MSGPTPQPGRLKRLKVAGPVPHCLPGPHWAAGAGQEPPGADAFACTFGGMVHPLLWSGLLFPLPCAGADPHDARDDSFAPPIGPPVYPCACQRVPTALQRVRPLSPLVPPPSVCVQHLASLSQTCRWGQLAGRSVSGSRYLPTTQFIKVVVGAEFPFPSVGQLINPSLITGMWGFIICFAFGGVIFPSCVWPQHETNTLYFESLLCWPSLIKSAPITCLSFSPTCTNHPIIHHHVTNHRIADPVGGCNTFFLHVFRVFPSPSAFSISSRIFFYHEKVLIFALHLFCLG